MSKRDIYSDLKRIEERGKKKKKGFGFWFSKKDKEEEEKEQAEAFIDLKPDQDAHVLTETSEWKPLEGAALEHAEKKLKLFKIKLERLFRDGKLTKEECQKMVIEKEKKLGLKPPE